MSSSREELNRSETFEPKKRNLYRGMTPEEPQPRSRPAWLAGLHGTIPSRVGVVILPFLLSCSTLTPTQQRLILTRSLKKQDLIHYFGGGGLSHRLRTNLSVIACYVFRIAFHCYCSFESREREGSISPPSARYLCRSSSDLPRISPTPLPRLFPYHTMTSHILWHHVVIPGQFLTFHACSCSYDQASER